MRFAVHGMGSAILRMALVALATTMIGACTPQPKPQLSACTGEPAVPDAKTAMQIAYADALKYAPQGDEATWMDRHATVLDDSLPMWTVYEKGMENSVAGHTFISKCDGSVGVATQ
jgi:hypothetical protein